MKVAFLVDNPLRDLPGLVLVACRLAREGCAVYLTPMNLAYYNRCEEILRLSPNFVVANYLRINNTAFLDQMRQLDIPVGILDTEGGVLVSCESYLKSVDVLFPYFRSVAAYFSWGPKLANFLIERGAYIPGQALVTGSPRHDFYVTPWNQAARESNPLVASYSRPIILLNSNFPIINPAFQTAANEKEMLVKQHGFTPEDAENICKTQKQAMVDFAQIANTLAREFPQVSVIYRPHPFESEDAYKALLEKRSNLHLVKKGTVDSWILQSACVVQRGCSTAIEAGIAGIPTFSPLWVPMHLVQQSAEAVSVPSANIEELVESVRAVLDGKFVIPQSVKNNLEQVLETWFYRCDGQAHDRVAEGILSKLNSVSFMAPPLASMRKVFQSQMAFTLRERIKGALGSFLGLSPTWSWVNFRKGQSSKVGKGPGVVQRWLAFWGFLLGMPRHHPWFKPYHGQWPQTDVWRNGPKAFKLEEVDQIVNCIRASAKGTFDGVQVAACQPGQDFVFGDHAGASVKIHS